MSNDIFDGVLMNVVQKAKGIDGFYDAIFGFMRRKTDFFSNPEKAKTTVLFEFQKHLTAFNEDKVRQDLIKQKQEELKRKQEEEIKAKQAPPVAETDSKVEEITDEEAEKLMSQQDSPAENSTSELLPTSDAKAEEGNDSDDGEPPLIGNGLKTDTYSFTQTLGDLTLNIFIPSHIKGKDLTVDYTQKKLKVLINGQDPIINGELCEKIIVDETLWTIDTIDGQKVVQITFDKADKMKWWD